MNNYRSSFDNTIQRVLVEKWEEGRASGYNDYYVPMEFGQFLVVLTPHFLIGQQLVDQLHRRDRIACNISNWKLKNKRD